MNKKIIVFLFIVLILAGVMYYTYQKYEKPQQEEITKEVNVSLIAKHKNKPITTGYKILRNERLIEKGNTYNKGFILKQLKTNKTLNIYNYNLENQNYYTDVKEFKLKNNKRVELDLIKSSKLNITQEEDIYSCKDNFDITISKINNKPYKNPHFCISWSSGFWYFKTLYEEVNIPERFEDNYDKCYDLNIKNLDKKTLNIKYKIFSKLYNEEVKIVFYDAEYILDEKNISKLIGANDKIKKLNINKC